MVTAIIPVFALLLSTSILLTGNGLQGTLLPIRANLEKFSTMDIGILGSAYFFGFALGCWIGPYLVRRVGHIRSFTALVCITASVVLIHALYPIPLVWWILRIFTGFCFAALYMIIESWLNEKSTSNTRGMIFSIYSIISMTVLTAGQLMITLYDPAEFQLFCMVAILISLSAIPIAMTTATSPGVLDVVRLRLIRLYRISPVGVAGCFAVGLANGSFWSVGPVFAQRMGLDITGIAYFMSITVIAGAIGQAPLGLVSDRMDRRKVIALTCLSAAAAGLAMVLFGKRFGQGILIFAFLFGSFAFSLYAICVAHANDFADPEDYVETASGLLLFYAIGAVIGPLAASSLMTIIGEPGLFGFTAVIHMATAAFAVARMRRRAPAPEEERTVFSEAILNAQTIAPLELGDTSKKN